MPLVDMPVEKLAKYKGRTPRPADFDRYWDRALREMRSTNPRLEMRPGKFQAACAECFDLFFTGVGGSRIHAKYMRPKNSRKPHPAVLMFHGYAGSAGDWNDKLNYVSLGHSIAMLDCRGQAGLSEDRGGIKGTTLNGHIIRGLDDSPDALLFRRIFLDTAQLAGIVMSLPEVDPKRVGVTGGSQGGGLSLACAALEPRIKKAVSFYPFLCDYKRVWEMDLAQNAYAELKTFFRMFDPRHERETEIFPRLGYIDVQHLAGRIRAETLMITNLMDTVCPPSTQFAAYNKIKARKKMIINPDFGHEGVSGSSDSAFNFLAEL